MKLKRIWADEKFANSLKSLAAEEGISVVQLSEELANAENDMKNLIESLNRRRKNAVKFIY